MRNGYGDSVINKNTEQRTPFLHWNGPAKAQGGIYKSFRSNVLERRPRANYSSTDWRNVVVFLDPDMRSACPGGDGSIHL